MQYAQNETAPAQNGPYAIGQSVDANAILALGSGGTQGLLLPRMTSAQRTTLGGLNPTEGIVVYDTDLKQVFYWHTIKWDAFASVEIVPPIDLTAQNNDISTTTLITPIIGGLYLLSGHANQAGGSGSINPTLSVTYTDHVGLNSAVPVGSVPVQHPGTPASYTFTLYSVAGQPIQYAVMGGSYGSATYDLALTLIKLS